MLVQAGQFLAGGEPVLDSPSGSGHPHQLGQWHRAGGVGPVEGILAVADPAANEQPVQAAAGGHRLLGDLDQRPVIPAGALGARPAESRCQARAGSGFASLAAGKVPAGVVTEWLLAIART